MKLGEKMKARREARGWQLADLARYSGVDLKTLAAIESRKSERSRYASQIAKALGVPVEEILSDSADVYALPVFDKHKAEEPPSAYQTMRPVLAWEHEDDLPAGQFVMVPKLDVRLSAGHGLEQVNIELDQGPSIAFTADWIRRERLKPSRLAAMKAKGDSMRPEIADGDMLVIDTSQADVIDGKTYALWYDGGERVKRLFRLPGGGLRIVSNNPDFPSVEIGPEQTEHVRIIGRVVHRAGSL